MPADKRNPFRNKKVLVFGLGLLGGGVATTNWLLKHGAKVTVTDLKTKKQLALSLKQIQGKAKYKLAGHDEKDIAENDIIVFNPDIPANSKYVTYARELGKQIENEATIFYKLCKKPIIAVTGTRGKTTTANWIAHLARLKYKTVVTGNATPGFAKPLLKTLDDVRTISLVVNEIPNFHLEYFDRTVRPPETAVITNIFQDHLNRYASFADYARTKANIFANQTASQNLILNYSNAWTPFFMRLKPRAKTWFFSEKKLPAKLSGVFTKNNRVYFQIKNSVEPVLDIKDFSLAWGGHNVQNLLAAALAAYINGVPWKQMGQNIKTLPSIPFRQEIIFNGSLRRHRKIVKITIVNDTSATSPDGGIAAIKRFCGSAERPNRKSCVLITGGTDRQLDYKQWSKIVKKYLKPENIVMLAGSATHKMRAELGSFGRKISVLETLAQCVDAGLEKTEKYEKSTVLFSPAAKSFEKFKNEYDRGEQFNALIKKTLPPFAFD